MRKNSAVVGDLSSDTFYHFWVTATVMDGSLHETNSTSITSNVTIFVPGITIAPQFILELLSMEL